MLYYITNYATKLDTPMWKRLALAADVFGQLRQQPGLRHQVSDSAKHDDRRSAVLNESRQFLMRVANRIFSERQLSAVEVCYHLLGYGPDFTNVPDWSFLNLTALYWSIFRRWPRLRCLAGQLTDAEEPPETIPLREGGRTLLYFDAYAFRGPILRDLCLYDYMSMISLHRRQGGGDDETHICLEGRPFVQRHESFYQELRRIQGGALSQYSTPSLEDIQAVANAQDLLHLQMLDEIETGPADARHSTGNADIDNILVRHDDTKIPLPRHSQNPVVQGPQMAVDTAPAGGFIGLGRIAASNYTLNHLQTMALQLVCSLLDRYTACQDSAAQHLQYTGGPGGTGKSRIIDALKDVFAARAQRHLLQITGTSGSAAARIGGTTVHSACGLDAHRSPNKPLPPFLEAKKWMWKQKMVLVVDEISMLGGATLYDVSQHL